MQKRRVDFVNKLSKLTITAFFIVLLVFIIFIVIMYVFTLKSEVKNIYDVSENKGVEAFVEDVPKDALKSENIDGKHTSEFEVYQNDKFLKGFFDYNEAVDYASKYENTSVKRYNGNEWLWDNTPQFNVYFEGDFPDGTFSTFAEAVSFAKTKPYADIYYRKNGEFIWNNHTEHKNRIIRGVPLINQYPELKRGCEVTSLAMLLNFKGYGVGKMELAEKIKKDTEAYRTEGGKIYYGNPNNGFVGDMYDYGKKGFGVYHKPVYELMSLYAGKKSVDLTGCSFDDLYYFIDKGSPIWVIINTKYKYLPPEEFQTWNTPSGEIKITYREHACIVVGYDSEYIYINDPLSKNSYEKKNKDEFIAAWEQMGKQALTIYK